MKKLNYFLPKVISASTSVPAMLIVIRGSLRSLEFPIFLLFDLTFLCAVIYYEIETKKINSQSKIQTGNKMETT